MLVGIALFERKTDSPDFLSQKTFPFPLQPIGSSNRTYHTTLNRFQRFLFNDFYKLETSSGKRSFYASITGIVYDVFLLIWYSPWLLIVSLNYHALSYNGTNRATRKCAISPNTSPDNTRCVPDNPRSDASCLVLQYDLTWKGAKALFNQ